MRGFEKVSIAISVLVFLAGGQAVRADNKCADSPDAAVKCFVKNAVKSGLAAKPQGMTMSQYKAYGVSVSRIVQTPPTLVFLLGTMGAAADALPPVNADGVTPNAAAQEHAVGAIVDAALKAAFISLPQGSKRVHLKMFALSVADTMGQNTGVTISPGALLRLLDSYLVGARSADGAVDWATVQTQINSLVDGLAQSGLLRLPNGVSSDGVKQFANDVAVAIDAYKAATMRSRLP
jgi:hypothetical protein